MFQSCSLASLLRDRAHLTFATKSADAVADLIRSFGFEVTSHVDDASILEYVETQAFDIVIFDKIDVNPDLARDIKRRTRSRLVIFTNLTEANRFADVAVTADIGSRFENISYVDQVTGTHTYFGPKFWVLRPDFYAYRARRKSPPTRLNRVLLLFGGSDPANLTSSTLDVLLRAPTPYLITVIVGAQFAHDADLSTVLERYDDAQSRITVHRNIRNVAQLMFESDLVIASPGLSIFEALCVRTPVVAVPHDELQRDTYDGHLKLIAKGELSELPALLERRDFTFPDDPHIIRMDIGNGVDELIDVILTETIHP